MMKNKIYTKNVQNKIEITSTLRSLVKRMINYTLDYEESDIECEVSVTFTDNEGIHKLNLEYRGKDAPTDVLSFPLLEDGEVPEELYESGNPIPIGDIVLSVEKAASQAQEYGHSLEREICYLTVHSVLHLLGYDHEISENDEKYMNTACEQVLNTVGLANEEELRKIDEETKAYYERSNKPKKTAFISLIGRPNVGKSTLMNTIIGEKVAIVSNKPQTTRNRITGIYTEGDSQYVFTDTPGIHKPKNKLGEFMMKSADESLDGTDLIVYLIESGQLPEKADLQIIEKIKSTKIPAILAINKIDIGKKDKLLLTIDKFSKLHDFISIIPISALNNDGVDILLNEIKPFLKEERWYFPGELLTSQPERQICSEIIREKLLRVLDDEIPHGIAVVIEDFKVGKRLVEIRSEIYCEKAAHKKIIIGKNGETLKKIASYAREDIEALLGKQVYLNLWVKVKEKWRDSELSLNKLGFDNEHI